MLHTHTLFVCTLHPKLIQKYHAPNDENYIINAEVHILNVKISKGK